MYSQSFRLLPLAIIFSSCAALAQTDSSADFYNLSLAELAQVDVSIATGNSTPLDRAPATASVIYAAEIAAMGAQTLNDVLETVPGLHISLSSLSRLDSVYSIRGIHTGFNPQVLLLLNGVPVQSSLQGGRPSLFRLPVASIDRVEVIRGPGSAVYGADAYSGVINVITKDATAMKGDAIGLHSGFFNSRHLWAQAATTWKDVGVAFSVAYQEGNGDPSRTIDADLQSFLDTAIGTQASLAPGALSTRYQILDTHLALSTEEIQFNLWNWRSTNAGVGAGGAQALDYEGKDDSHLTMSDLTYHFDKWSEVWDNSVRLSYLYYDLQARFTLLPDGTVLPIGEDGNLNFVAPAGVVAFPEGLIGNPGQQSQDSQIDIVSMYTGFDSHRLRIAVGAKEQELDARETKNFGPGVIDGTVPVVDGTLTNVTNTPYIFLADSSRSVRYLSLQDEWQIITDLELTTGLRYDDYSDFGSTTNPRIALVWAANEKLTTKILYGSAFRAPSFAELYFKNNPVSLGNTELKPEQIDTQELSLNVQVTSSVQTSLTYFQYQATDMIEFVPDVDVTTKRARNARDQDGEGVELEAHWKPSSQLHLSGSFSLQDAEDAATGIAIPDAPGKQLKFNANWAWATDWSLNGQLYWIADRARAEGDPRADIDDYTLIHFTLHRKNIIPQLDASLAVRNLANQNAREPSSGGLPITVPDDYPLESRSIWLGLSYRFQ